MEIKVLGKGCKKCDLLQNHVEKALEIAGVEATISKVKEAEAIEGYGVMQTPALLIDDKVVSEGRVLSAKKIATLLSH